MLNLSQWRNIQHRHFQNVDSVQKNFGPQQNGVRSCLPNFSEDNSKLFTKGTFYQVWASGMANEAKENKGAPLSSTVPHLSAPPPRTSLSSISQKGDKKWKHYINKYSFLIKNNFIAHKDGEQKEKT